MISLSFPGSGAPGFRTLSTPDQGHILGDFGAQAPWGHQIDAKKERKKERERKRSERERDREIKIGQEGGKERKKERKKNQYDKEGRGASYSYKRKQGAPGKKTSGASN